MVVRRRRVDEWKIDLSPFPSRQIMYKWGCELTWCLSLLEGLQRPSYVSSFVSTLISPPALFLYRSARFPAPCVLQPLITCPLQDWCSEKRFLIGIACHGYTHSSPLFSTYLHVNKLVYLKTTNHFSVTASGEANVTLLPSRRRRASSPPSHHTRPLAALACLQQPATEEQSPSERSTP